MKELYKDVYNYEGYQVSNLGNVKSFKGKKEKILKSNKTSSGYLSVGLSNNNKVKSFQVHQLVAMMFLDHTPSGFKIVVDHKDCNKLNNTINNLQLLTHRENLSKDDNKCSSKYTGVSWNNKAEKWQSIIYMNGKNKNLGYFNTELEASNRYQLALKGL